MDLNKPHLRYKNQTRRERTWTIHLISAEKVIKGTVLTVVALKLLSMLGSDVHASAEAFVTRHGIDIANRYVHDILEKLVGVGNNQLVEFSTVAFIYAALLFIEGIGLWMQYRWAEYLTAISTALFIPIEGYEIYQRFTWVRIAILALNIFVVWYLSTRLRDEKKEFGAVGGEMSPTKVKICGITNLEDALLAVKFGADELGFNFYKKSQRYISPDAARKIIDELPPNILKVGVFVNESIDSIDRIAKVACLDTIQLHGDEDFSCVSRVRKRTGLQVIKALRITSESVIGDAMDYDSDAILLDSYSSSERGGTGETADWDVAQEVGIFVPHAQLYLAGGLSAVNVAEAIRKVRPYAVDACSRLESAPGKKDPEKLEKFISAAKETI